MYLSVDNKDDRRYGVVDIDNKKFIRGVQWADDETGEYEKLVFDDDGLVVLEYDTNGEYNPIIEKRKGNICFVDLEDWLNRLRNVGWI